MLTKRSRTWVAAGIAAAAAGGYLASQGLAAGSGMPANKAVAAGSKVKSIAVNGVEELMSATFKTSKPEDLLISVSAECSILTDVVIPGSTTGGVTQTANARGAVRIWVELDGKIVPIEDVSNPPQDPAGNGNGTDADKVTFCDRLHERTVTDREDPEDGIDGSRDYIDTKSANAFNWVRLNAGSGPHTLKVFGQFTTSAVGAGSNAAAYVGNRSLVIEPTKLANDAVIARSGTS
ncbi:MAG TPA: hypothetical protein VNQ77_17245 [Frankiaceae bacterium]|nr:hypothetical protein [Frankiaceae bacterium]